jgi:starch phosphorylase
VNRYLKFTPQDRKVAYFSMEIGLMPELPIYSGGLGVLAGDTLKSFADLGIPAVGVSLLSEKGYFHQVIDDGGMQAEVAVKWDPAALMMAPLSEKVTLRLEQRTVLIQAWVYDLKGIGGSSVPILFLDTNLEQKRTPGPTIDQLPLWRRPPISIDAGGRFGNRRRPHAADAGSRAP